MKKEKVIGVIPVRMGSSRFPGKPLEKICGVPMVRHIYERSKICEEIDELVVATCDTEIQNYCKQNSIPVLMTSLSHTRALDRVCEAAGILNASEKSIIINLQGDEPLVSCQLIKRLISEFIDPGVNSCLLGIAIKNKDLFANPDTVKLVTDNSDFLLYSSRGNIPYQSPEKPIEDAYRVAGMFAFRFHELKLFSGMVESKLEVMESCDINRMIENSRKVKVSKVSVDNYFSVDSPSDIKLVESVMSEDLAFQKYRELL